MTKKRRKLTKNERALLWYIADGKCNMCGIALPEDWHADHIIPFSKTHDTNIHEMQALCPSCNLKKGAKMYLRKHQVNLLKICEDMIKGRSIKQIICSVTPGGGKSALPIILAHKLIPGLFDKICWVVPRSSLREQGEASFVDPYFRQPFVLGHNHTIRQSTNDWNPTRNLSGFITTYQAVAQSGNILTQEFDRYNYILFLDEPHHVSVNSPFETSLKPLVDRAGLVVYASGTLERGDGRQIAFLPYKNIGGGLVIDKDKSGDTYFIEYTRTDALKEQAIIPIEFIQSDSKAQWINRVGEVEESDSLLLDDIDFRAALRTSLETSFATELINKTVAHWKGHKSHSYHEAKLLVVAPTIYVAKTYLEHLKISGIQCAIVHSKEKDTITSRKIKRFKSGSIDALVTVAIAYEGLDVPEITHVACLTHYRSKPWLEQLFARATRKRGKKEMAFVFAPDDPEINRVIIDLIAEQEVVIDNFTQIQKKRKRSEDDDDDYDDNPLGIVPQASVLTHSRASFPTSGDDVNTEQYKLIEKSRVNARLPEGLSITALNRFIIEIGYMTLQNNDSEPDLSVPLVTPSEQEKNLRKSIDTYTKKIDRIYHSMDWGTTNREIYLVFRKKRDEMDLQELQSLWRWLQDNYPLEVDNGENSW